MTAGPEQTRRVTKREAAEQIRQVAVAIHGSLDDEGAKEWIDALVTIALRLER